MRIRVGMGGWSGRAGGASGEGGELYSGGRRKALGQALGVRREKQGEVVRRAKGASRRGGGETARAGLGGRRDGEGRTEGGGVRQGEADKVERRRRQGRGRVPLPFQPAHPSRPSILPLSKPVSQEHAPLAPRPHSQEMLLGQGTSPLHSHPNPKHTPLLPLTTTTPPPPGTRARPAATTVQPNARWGRGGGRQSSSSRWRGGGEHDGGGREERGSATGEHEWGGGPWWRP